MPINIQYNATGSREEGVLISLQDRKTWEFCTCVTLNRAALQPIRANTGFMIEKIMFCCPSHLHRLLIVPHYTKDSFLTVSPRHAPQTCLLPMRWTVAVVMKIERWKYIQSLALPEGLWRMCGTSLAMLNSGFKLVLSTARAFHRRAWRAAAVRDHTCICMIHHYGAWL